MVFTRAPRLYSAFFSYSVYLLRALFFVPFARRIHLFSLTRFEKEHVHLFVAANLHFVFKRAKNIRQLTMEKKNCSSIDNKICA